jgi:hypothetical protein
MLTQELHVRQPKPVLTNLNTVVSLVGYLVSLDNFLALVSVRNTGSIFDVRIFQ